MSQPAFQLCFLNSEYRISVDKSTVFTQIIFMCKIEVEDLSIKAYKAIKAMIVSHQLKPGDRLRQEELAERFGISRTPILSAISKLEKEMLIEISPRKGAFIKRYTKEDIANIHEIRLKLEPLAAREAALHAKAQDKEELLKLLEKFSECIELHNDGLLRESNYNLHMKIIEISGNQILYNIISMFSIVMLSNTIGFLKNPEVIESEHKKIVQAVVDNDEKLAEELMLVHIQTSKNNLSLEVANEDPSLT